jgi:hypothetical protein
VEVLRGQEDRRWADGEEIKAAQQLTGGDVSNRFCRYKGLDWGRGARGVSWGSGGANALLGRGSVRGGGVAAAAQRSGAGQSCAVVVL